MRSRAPSVCGARARAGLLSNAEGHRRYLEITRRRSVASLQQYLAVGDPVMEFPFGGH